MIESPCVNICMPNEDGICQGCYRTIDEIADWMFLSEDEQLTILKTAQQRKAFEQ